MKNQIQKDKFKRNLHFNSEEKIIILKSIVKNKKISKNVRWNSELELNKLPISSFKVQQVNRCILTGRKKKANKLLKVSRLAFLKFVRAGFIPGFKKYKYKCY